MDLQNLVIKSHFIEIPISNKTLKMLKIFIATLGFMLLGAALLFTKKVARCEKSCFIYKELYPESNRKYNGDLGLIFI